MDIRKQLLQLFEQNQRTASEKLTKRQCQAFYPDGSDSALFFEIQERLGSLGKAEILLVLCDYDFSLAHSIAKEAASLFHCNMEFLKNLYKKFDKDINKVVEYLRKFKEHHHQQQEKAPTTTHCKTALKTLNSFHDNITSTNEFLTKFDSLVNAQCFLDKFDAKGEQAKSYLTSFENDVKKANEFLFKFNDKGIKASDYLKKFNSVEEGKTFLQQFTNENEANGFLQNFADGNEANIFLKEFNGSSDYVSKFVKSFDTSKDALEHLGEIKRKCDNGTDNSCGDDCKWFFDEKTKTLFIRGSGEMKDYEWDDDDDDEPTTPWYSKREQIENVVIGEGITTIGDYAFSKCSSLTSITIPNSVATIGNNAFSDCSITSLTITGTGEMKFTPKEISTELATVVISEGITTIRENAFSNCSSLTSITIPSSVTTIGNNAFDGCSITSVRV